MEISTRCSVTLAGVWGCEIIASQRHPWTSQFWEAMNLFLRVKALVDGSFSNNSGRQIFDGATIECEPVEGDKLNSILQDESSADKRKKTVQRVSSFVIATTEVLWIITDICGQLSIIQLRPEHAPFPFCPLCSRSAKSLTKVYVPILGIFLAGWYVVVEK
ncbi:hypothetical protein E2542_SST08157 [Spatholobus suberectus]|nr:hypothetical protein E2542_SST08157 [Spatholobus suberectus]